MSERRPLLASDAQEQQQPTKLTRYQFFMVMFSLYFGVYLAALDSTVVSTLLSHIASDLKQLDNISWVATAYLISYSAFQPLYGKISDIFGRRYVLVFCNFMFAAGCLLCGVAPSLKLLIFGRFVSGVGAGGLLSLSTITVSDFVPLRERGIYQGINNVAFGIGAATGGVFGGVLTSWAGWRLAFTAQVPLSIVGAIIMYIYVVDKKAPDTAVVETDMSVLDEEMSMSLAHRRAQSRSRRASIPVARNSFSRIDITGSFTLVLSLLLFMLAVTTGGSTWPWTSPFIIGCILSSIGVMAFFVYWELNHALEPVLPIPILAHRSIIASCLTNFFSAGTSYSFLFYSPIYLSAMYGYDYNVIARRLIANFLGVALGSLAAGIYMRRTAKYYGLGITSTTVMMLACAMFAIMPYLSHSVSDTVWYQSVGYFANGMGYTSILTVSLVALIAAVPVKFQAMTTSAQYTFRGAGSSIGTAAAASIFQNVLAGELTKRVQGKHAAEIIDIVGHSVEAIRTIPEKYQPAVIRSYEMAGMSVMLLCVGLSFAATVTTSLQQQHELGGADDIGEAPTPH